MACFFSLLLWLPVYIRFAVSVDESEDLQMIPKDNNAAGCALS
jgi:hypothetical protein